MKLCPICGKYMNNKMTFEHGANKNIWYCKCGYSTYTDRSGLTWWDVKNRYQLSGERSK